MKRVIISLIFSALLFVTSIQSRADEGMWLLNLISKLNQSDMEAMGLKLTAEEIYSINNSSLKDAVVSLGGFCTAEVVSSKGLLLTNHHCGYPSIVQNSTVENDYATNGFWAMSYNEELPAKGLFVKFLVRIEDVTEQVFGKLDKDMTEQERTDALKKIADEIREKAVEGTHYQAEIKEFYFGNQYYLFIYEVYNDVRLVGAPPESIGNFGGDTDNWMWPRHTGDFAMFRVYTGPDGKPAAYSKDNIPLEAKKWLPVSTKGYKENDFAMIIGYPGTTNRSYTSHAVKGAFETVNPAIVKIREKKLEIMDKDMKSDDQIRLIYATKYASTANYWKYFIGQNKGILRNKVIERKQIDEENFMNWVNNASVKKTDIYNDALGKVEQAYKTLPELLYIRTYLREAMLRGSDIIQFAIRFKSLVNELKKDEPDNKKIEEMKTSLLSISESFFKTFVVQTEKKLFAAMNEMYFKDVVKSYHPEGFADIEKKFNKDFYAFAEKTFSTSIFSDLERCKKFINKPSIKAAENDPIYKIASSVDDLHRQINKDISTLNDTYNAGMRLYMKGLMEMQPSRKFYPDANSTMRLTYGKVEGYFPADAVTYHYATYLEGIMKKENPDDSEFIVPSKLKELYTKKDYGRYADKQGNMPVCFLTNLDITGGNSGSPVINGKGELIGIAFDGNWEAMSGDIVYEPALQRTISVDIRYVLFVIDKYAGATRLIEEMEIR